MRRFLLGCFIVFYPFLVQSQYRVSDLSENQKKDVDAVIVLDQGLFEVKSTSQSSFKYKGVITILNSKAKGLAEIVLGYDKSVKAKFTKANVYDANGKLVYKLKKSDIVDQSSISGFSVYEDNRLKYLDLRQNTYPYTIEYETEEEYDYLYVIPSWNVVPTRKATVIKSQYRVTGPIGLKPRYKQYNVKPGEFDDRSTASVFDFNWSFENVEHIEREPYGPNRREYVPKVYLSPRNFEYGGYSGDLTSWNGLANWQRKLNQGRDALPPATVAEVKALVAGLSDDRAKIKAVYEYLQGKTRYVSIQLGIGGLQPFPAIEVDDLGYGDCKALSNYTRSLLKAVGIDALYTKVDAGDNPRPLDPDFSIPSFNHIILCVPNKGDTVWLECTSQTNPFGYMGTFTGDRDVLVVTEDGGKIVHTPVYDHHDNRQLRSGHIDLDENGKGNAEISTLYTGLEYEQNGLNFMLQRGQADQKGWVLENSDFANFQLDDYKMDWQSLPVPEATVTASYSLGRYARASGKRMFFELNPLSKRNYIPPAVEDRKTDFLQNTAVTEKDSLVFTFPERFNIEYLPEGTQFESKFGSYESKILRDEGKLTYIRKFVLWKKRYSPDEYEEYRNFMKRVVVADDVKVVVNKTT